MHRLKIAVLALSATSIVLTGCSGIKDKVAGLTGGETSTTEQSTEGSLTAEQQALIGTYTEDGSLIVGFDESGWMITEAPDVSVVTQNELGLQYTDFLNNTTYYDSLAIVTRNETGKVLSTIHYQMDYDGKIGRKDWFTDGKVMGTTYYDTYRNKAYTNIGLVGWEEVSSERLDNLMVIFNNAYFTLDEYSSDNMYVYVKGSLVKDAVGDGTILMSEIYKQLPTLTDMTLFNMYDKVTHKLVRAEIKVNCPQGVYTVSAVPEETNEMLTIPEYAKNPSAEVTQPVTQGIVNIPLRAYLYSALYTTDDPASIDREWLINEYQFRAAELEDTYGIKRDEVDVFLQALQDIDDSMSVEEFLSSYAMKDGKYSSAVENAVYVTIYDRLSELDKSLTQDIFDAMVIKSGEAPNVSTEEPSTEESTEETTEEESTEETTEEETTEEVVEEPQYTVWYCNGTTVNKRTGPGTNYDKAGQLHLDDEVWVVGTSTENSDWSECVDANGNTYYVKSSFLRKK